MRFEPPPLIDTTTGSSFTRWDLGGATMTTEITKHPYRQLEGKAFVSLTDDVMAAVNDDAWEEILGMHLVLPGGCELDVDGAELQRALEDIEECDEHWDDAMTRRPDLFHGVLADGGVKPELLVPLIVNDVDMPRARVLLEIGVLRKSFQAVERGAGANANPKDGSIARFSTCRHTAQQIGTVPCRSCFRRWWTIEARKAGLIDG